ncbi:MAG: type II secretion system protein [Prosthecobacter sp.]|uniref:type II secretion system protein n=1 Tax=Prosthecobacter sp. TaxID=1965333 RepID=UPI003901CEFD
MKLKRNVPNLPRQGFTLIELLVVITIIAILAGLVMGQANKMMADARKLQVQTVIKDLRIAIASYQVEYNRYPVNSSMLSSASDGQDIQALLTDENSGIVSALMSTSSSSSGGSGGGGATNLNPRDIKFIDLPIAKNGMYGLVNAQPPYKLVDLWGLPYYVLLDTNGDKQVPNPDLKNSDPTISQNATSPPPQNLPTEVAIYSWGLDKVGMTKDDVVSWRSK